MVVALNETDNYYLVKRIEYNLDYAPIKAAGATNMKRLRDGKRYTVYVKKDDSIIFSVNKKTGVSRVSHRKYKSVPISPVTFYKFKEKFDDELTKEIFDHRFNKEWLKNFYPSPNYRYRSVMTTNSLLDKANTLEEYIRYFTNADIDIEYIKTNFKCINKITDMLVKIELYNNPNKYLYNYEEVERIAHELSSKKLMQYYTNCRQLGIKREVVTDVDIFYTELNKTSLEVMKTIDIKYDDLHRYIADRLLDLGYNLHKSYNTLAKDVIKSINGEYMFDFKTVSNCDKSIFVRYDDKTSIELGYRDKNIIMIDMCNKQKTKDFSKFTSELQTNCRNIMIDLSAKVELIKKYSFVKNTSTMNDLVSNPKKNSSGKFRISSLPVSIPLPI